MGEHTASPPCREISAATQPMRRMLVSRSSWEKVSPALRWRRTTSPSRLVIVRLPSSSIRSITAWARVDLPLPDRPVKNSTTPCSPGGGPVVVDDGGDLVAERGSRRAGVLGQGDDRVLAGVGAQHPDAELVVGLGVAVRRQGYGDHGGVREPARGGEAGPQEPHGRQGRGAVADQGDQHHPAVDALRGGAICSSSRASVTGTQVAPA